MRCRLSVEEKMKCEHRTLNAEHCLRLCQLGLRRISPSSLALAPRSTLNGGREEEKALNPIDDMAQRVEF